MELDENELELTAQITALRILMEQVWANVFIHDEPGFNAIMEGLQRMTHKGTVVNSASQEENLELFARTNVHLQRFQQRTAERIRQGRQT